MIRLGLLDFDTSHAVEFARRLNHQGIAPDQWVEGARVVVACPGTSRMSPDRIPGFTREIAQLGIPLVDQPTDMIGQVEGVLVESLEGAVHLDRARPFLEAGLPCFIDKPFTCGVADARRIVALAKRQGAPLFSSSSLRYAPELVAFLADPARGTLLGAESYGPAPSFQGPSGVQGNPGLFHYGIHALELLYTLMGPGCASVCCHHTADADVVVARWHDGRLASLRGLRAGKTGYGFLAFTDTGIHHVGIETEYIYRELLVQVVEFFRTGKPPVAPETTVEIMAFLEAALISAGNGGTVEVLK